VSWIAKLDPSGTPQWQKLVGCFGLPPGDYANGVSLQQTADGGYVVAGGTLGCGPATICPSQCALVERLDAGGTVLWSHVYSSGGDDRESTLNQIRQTRDRGFVAVGSFRTADDALGAWVLKLDGGGNVQYQRKLGPGGASGPGRVHAYLNAVDPTSDGGYVAAGELTSYERRAEGDTGVLVVRLDASGNVAWQRGFNSFDGNGVPTASEHALSILQTADGGYLVGGNWNSTAGRGTCCRGALLLKLDTNGDTQWQKAHSGGVYCFFNGFNTTCHAIGADVYSLESISNGGYLLAGSGDLRLTDSVPLVPWLAKADASGNLVWQRFYYQSHPTTGRPLSQYFASSDVTSSGLLALGFTSDPVDLSGELFAVKTDDTGLVGSCSQPHPATPLNLVDPGLATIAPALPVQATAPTQANVPSETRSTSISATTGAVLKGAGRASSYAALSTIREVVFTVEQRDAVREWVLTLAEEDQRVVAGAAVGSLAIGSGDRFSDLDLTFAVADGVPVSEVLDDWTRVLSGDLAAVQLVDLERGPTIYRVFLLPAALQFDLSLTPAARFAAAGPRFRLLFGETAEGEDRAPKPPAADDLFGWGVIYGLHARACIERGRVWQAEHYIGAVRDHALSLACRRRELTAVQARGYDDLAADTLAGFDATHVGSLEPERLRSALSASLRALLRQGKEANVPRWDVVAQRLAELRDGT
jgi:hypothetical protein